LIRRRAKQGKDQRRDENAPEPFFNFTSTDPGPAADAPLFNLEELHERRILSWSPEPEEFFEDDPRPQADAGPTRAEREEAARSAYDRPAPQPELQPAPPQAAAARVVAPEPATPEPVSQEPALPEPVQEPAVVQQPVIRQPAVSRPFEAPPARPVQARPAPAPARDVAPPAPSEPAATALPQAEAPAAEGLVDFEPTQAAPKKRGRPRGRPRRQVHFHVDPDEERLLMAAVEKYGSQQKGLIAALESLHEADMLRDEIERLRAEVARHRRLLDEAESLFSR
jgi:hypothetical protein